VNNNYALRIKPTVQVLRGDGKLYLRNSCMGTEIEDHTGLIGDIVEQLDGTRSIEAITGTLSSTRGAAVEQQVLEILQGLDNGRLLEESAQAIPSSLDKHDLERWSRNFDFLGTYCHANENKYLKQIQVRDARIALLGLGGLGSHLLYDLVAFGFSNIRAVDYDNVELANLNRQILYSEMDIGRAKTDVAAKRIREFNHRVKLEVFNTRLNSTADVSAIIDGMDAVVCVADKPTYLMGIWLNEACVKAGVPFINGGVDNQCAVYYTVLPRVTGCAECWKQRVQSTDAVSAEFLSNEINTQPEVPYRGPAVVPLVSVLTGFMASELIRVVTGLTPPVATNRLRAIDFTTMETEDLEFWDLNPECLICGRAKGS
jgi:molybdopterin/thiamine biosynthesis adenylyltransferase